jgi:hypothetical protein
MSCQSCSCCTPGTTCDSCGSYVSIENGRVQPINAASNIRVSDRNGLPRNLVSNDSSLAASDKYGEVKMRDGSSDNPINLALLRSIAAVTKGVVVIDGEGNIAHLPRADVDSYLITRGGVITWGTSMPRSNFLLESELSPYRDKILTLGCSTNGLVEIGFLDLSEGDYIGVDSDGKPVVRQFCDAEAVELLDSVIGCSGGVLSKLNGIADKKLLINEDGKYYLDDAVDDETWVGGPTLWSKSLSEPRDADFADVNVAFGGTVPNTALWVQICVQMWCTTSTTLGTIRIYINDIPVIVERVVGNFGSFAGSVCMYVQYGAGTVKIRGSFVESFPGGSDGGEGEVTISIISYK